MPRIVQFPHPGQEHGSDRGNRFHKSWNSGSHRRKFIISRGDYVDNKNNLVTNAELQCWAEWEPTSDVSPLKKNASSLFPRNCHRPYIPKEQLASLNQLDKKGSCKADTFQNTDPFIFGNQFKYSLCKQYKDKNGILTSLAKLETGSVILFGSTKGRERTNSFFQLDTVFVVSHYLEYDPSINKFWEELKVPQYYKDLVLKLAFPKSYKKSLKFRLYFGATYQNPVGGMYSFTPSKISNEELVGFPRLRLENLNYLTNNLNSAPKYTDCTLNKSSEIWNSIRELSRRSGYLEAVRLNLPLKK